MIFYEDELADSGVSLLTVKVVSLNIFIVSSVRIFSSLYIYISRRTEHICDFAESDAKLLVSSLAFLG